MTKGGEILNIVSSLFCCFNLIISRYKIAKYVTSHKVGGESLRNVITCDKDGGGVKKIMKFM